ncbi:MAG: DNA polymerase III, subunit gamma and tau [Nitrospinae bacterium RIFCSPLOWO2_12_FULL_47_7]|nr:MAG: DNA polymerase III, subunit gamma and tau [Nitrospinae bacterium RIFCSPLOWO2_12_FULL_47_7]
MEFQVSARKWRPQKFGEMIGQEPIVRTLTNAISFGRISHAYLFSGTRGVGKTTAARIFAKALNCVNGPTPDPCDACLVCLEIKEGRSVDVQEIDGASNTGVSEVRDIIENIRYAASSCRYKVYIIDEVHMLSKSAFNALLKTLEEPPPKVVFVFATTEQHKIPETILSRCQCFEFKPLSQGQLIRQMKTICEHEGIKIDDVSMEEIAKSGAGSMRDAQSLLDQVIAFSGKEITSGAVESVLGIVGQEVLETFVDLLVQKNAAALLELVQRVVGDGKDLNLFCRDLIEYFRNLLFVTVAKKPETLLNIHTCDVETLKRQAQAFHPDQIQQAFQVLSRTEMEMKRSSLPQMVFEMAVFRLNDVRPFHNIDEMIRKIRRLESDDPRPVRSNSQPEPSIIPAEQAPSGQEPVSTGTPSPSSMGTDSIWENIKQEICNKKHHLNIYLDDCSLAHLDAKMLQLEFPDPYTLGLIDKEENIQIMKEAVKVVCGHSVEVKLSVKKKHKGVEPIQANSEEKKRPEDYNKPKSKSEAEIIQDALDIFGGTVIR